MQSLKTLAVMALMIQGFLLVTTVQSQAPSDGSVDLSKYKTYRWVPSDPDPTATAQRRSNHAKIRSAIEEILNSKGFLYQEEGPVDLLVDFLGVGRDKTEFSSQPYDTGSYRTIRVVTEGTLMVDIVEAKKELLLWRGWATETIRGSEEFDRKLSQALSKMFENFPSR